MSRRTEKRRYGKYNKFDVVYADFGKNPHGIQGGIRPGKSGTVIEDSGVREEIDRALIRQFDLLPVARKMVMEELANGQQN